MRARTSTTAARVYERQPFREFLRTFRWKQGEHMLLAAPTQTGKSTLASYLVAKRTSVVVLASKGKDANLAARYADYNRRATWEPQHGPKLLLWPKKQATNAQNIAHQKAVFREALDSVGRTGGWCVVVDEGHWATEFLGLGKDIAVLHHQGSSAGITMVTLTQRPAWIPRITYSSSSHVFLGNTTDRDDLKALADMGGVDAAAVRQAVMSLGRHDLLYLNPMGDAPPRIINIRQ